ncbi:MAG: hypothetical protein JW803_00540 [Endomicrobiales bacterium]|nr:hypothetical protein [Endomicrobiales bacterium]
MLKKVFSFLSIIAVAAVAPVFSATRVAPYYSLSFYEGVAIPSKGEWMMSTTLTADIGGIFQFDQRHSAVGFYEIKYAGPGFKRQEGEKFTDRLMDHIIIGRHHYKIDEKHTFKTQLDYMKEYKRTGSNEVWGTGLYDLDRYGIALYLDRKMSPDLTLSFAQQYHFLKFPNYTDLLAEFQAGGEAVESSTGKQNQTSWQTQAMAWWKSYKFLFDLNVMSYEKQKVISGTVQSDGTFYTGDLQKDILISLNAQQYLKLLGRIEFTPSVTVKFKDSNQNYQHFTVANSTVPVAYFSDYYDYRQIMISMPAVTKLTEKWDLYFNPEFDYKIYTSRPPRSGGNEFMDGKQTNFLTIFNFGFTFKPNDITKTTLFYVFQNQASNMEFEKYLPYNYTGHYMGINFNYSF